MMQKRNTQQRRADIVSWVDQHGQAQVDQLAKYFGTSEVTIRKDLTILAEKGLIVRQFGGAAPLRKIQTIDTQKPEIRKLALGKMASTLLSDSSKIILDSGSTTGTLLSYLNQTNLVVMTNSLMLATTLTQSESEPTVLMTGGTWDPHSHSFQGKMAESMIAAYSFDIAFIGASGLDVNRGSTTFNELTGLSKTMASVARTVVVMAESDKFSHRMPNLELAWDDIDVLITDHDISEQQQKKIKNYGVQIMIADSKGEEVCAGS